MGSSYCRSDYEFAQSSQRYVVDCGGLSYLPLRKAQSAASHAIVRLSGPMTLLTTVDRGWHR